MGKGIVRILIGTTTRAARSQTVKITVQTELPAAVRGLETGARVSTLW